MKNIIYKTRWMVQVVRTRARFVISYIMMFIFIVDAGKKSAVILFSMPALSALALGVDLAAIFAA